MTRGKTDSNREGGRSCPTQVCVKSSGPETVAPQLRKGEGTVKSADALTALGQNPACRQVTAKRPENLPPGNYTYNSRTVELVHGSPFKLARFPIRPTKRERERESFTE